jgi:prepilin-type N-terminal cleavage/methylation domain-containing protein
MFPFHSQTPTKPRRVGHPLGHPVRRQPEPLRRRGLSLVELIISTAIVSMIAVAMATLSTAVNVSQEAATNIDRMTQHGRASIRRIRATINSAHSSTQFPGFIVLTHTVSGSTIPDTLVVWTPPTSANDPDGLPLVEEIKIYMPDSSNARHLLELSRPGDTTTVPALANTAAWDALVASIYTDDTAIRLTKYLRTVDLSGNTVSQIRFTTRLRPDQSQIDAYIAMTATWDDIYWPQNMYTANTGTRQNQCLFELQLLDDPPAPQDHYTFVGSGSVFYLFAQP